MRARPAGLLALLALAAPGGCLQSTGLCQADGDCPQGQRCDVIAHRCQPPGPGPAPGGDAGTPPDLSAPRPGADLRGLPVPDGGGGTDGPAGPLLQVSHDGDGTITSDPAGIQCGDRCSASFAAGTRVTLNAQAGLSAVFTGWSGACSGTAACQVTLPGSGAVQAGARFAPRVWRRVSGPATAPLRAISGAGGAAWIVGDGGVALRWDGSAWQRKDTGLGKDLAAIWVHDAALSWAVGAGGTPVRWDGTSWKETSGIFINDLYAVWGSDPSLVLAAGQNGTVLQGGSGDWNPITDPGSDTYYALGGVAGTPPPAITDLWLAGAGGALLRWNGHGFTAVASGTKEDLHALWAADRNLAFAAGAGGVLLRWDGSKWSGGPGPVPEATLRALWGFPAGRFATGAAVWAVGDRGVVLRLDSSAGTWVKEDSGSVLDLYGVWGDRPGDLWAVGDGGVILHDAP